MNNNIRYSFWDGVVERRKSPRCKLVLNVDYLINGKPGVPYKKMLTCNISRDGTLLFGSDNIDIGNRMDVTFAVPFSDFREITLPGIIIRVDSSKYENIKYIAIKFDKNIYQNRIGYFVNDAGKGFINR